MPQVFPTVNFYAWFVYIEAYAPDEPQDKASEHGVLVFANPALAAFCGGLSPGDAVSGSTEFNSTD